MNSIIFSSLLGYIGIVAAAYLAYRYALKQLYVQAHIQIEQDLNRRRADALQQAWQLLRYLSPHRNASSVIECTREPDSEKKLYTLNTANTLEFIDHALPEAFYNQQAGLYWQRTHKEKLFKCCTMLHVILRHARQANSPLPSHLPLNPLNVAEEIYRLYSQLNDTLRADIEAVYADKPCPTAT